MPPVLLEILSPLLAVPVAVLGAGVSGRTTCELITSLGGTAVLYDEKDAPGSRSDYPAEAARHRLVIFSPGFAPEHPWLHVATTSGATCLTELDFAACFWRGRVIAITGTNGKTTLTEFLTHALRHSGHSAFAAGNIGYTLARLVREWGGGTPADIAIVEVSSFQAEVLQNLQAEAVLWTNFAEDHLERHDTLARYFAAKAVLFTRSTHAYVGTSVTNSARELGLALPAEAHTVATLDQPADPRLADTVFAQYPQYENFLLAAAWWRDQGLPEEALLDAARTFQLGPHRLAKVKTVRGVTWWNDSKATNFHAVEAAVAGFAQPVLLIAGGRAKGGDIGGFVRRLAPRVRHALLIGDTRDELAWHCAALHVAHDRCIDLADAVQRAAAHARPGDHVLLSPGFASFDQFRSYADRGEQFTTLVQHLPAA